MNSHNLSNFILLIDKPYLHCLHSSLHYFPIATELLHNSDISRVCPALSCNAFKIPPKEHGQACLNHTNIFSSLLYVAVINILSWSKLRRKEFIPSYSS